MNEAEKQQVRWSEFKETVLTGASFLGFLWMVMSSSLMIVVVLRAIFR